MGMNKELVGKKYGPEDCEVNKHEAMYYALSSNDYNEAYIDGRREGGIVAPPMYIVSKEIGGRVISLPLFDQELKVDFAMLVHGEQEIEWLKPLIPDSKLKSTSSVLDIIDKGSGELLKIGVETEDEKGELVARQVIGFFVRGGGSGKKSEKKPAPPEDRSKKLLEETMNVLQGQTYVYAEASGDHNPIHIDNNFATAVGLPGIILQGLCTMAFVQKAVVDSACKGDPSKLKKLSVRFSRPVLPGDTLTTIGWEKGESGDRTVVGLETTNQKGDVVVKEAYAEVAK
jgi:acyl dehydratase